MTAPLPRKKSGARVMPSEGIVPSAGGQRGPLSIFFDHHRAAGRDFSNQRTGGRARGGGEKQLVVFSIIQSVFQRSFSRLLRQLDRIGMDRNRRRIDDRA